MRRRKGGPGPWLLVDEGCIEIILFLRHRLYRRASDDGGGGRGGRELRAASDSGPLRASLVGGLQAGRCRTMRDWRWGAARSWLVARGGSS